MFRIIQCLLALPALKPFSAFVVALFGIAAQAQNLVINEVMPANLGEALDPSCNFAGWAEIYNPSSREVSLNGLTVADAKGHSFLLTRDHGTVPARGFRCLWFGTTEVRSRSGSTLFPSLVPFKLDTDGGSLTLQQGSAVVDALAYPAAVSRCSWARTADGADDWSFCAWPTPEATNAGAAFSTERLPAPQPSVGGGWLEGTQRFDVSVATGAALHYTTDGSVPTLASRRAEVDADGLAHFVVSENTVYRFRALPTADAPLLPSSVVTRSFITRSYTKTVTDGWGWDNWDNWDNWGWDNTHEETTTFSGFSLLSVVTDPDYLYDDRLGLYVEGTNGGWSYWTYANYYNDWDRPVNVEIFSPEGLPLVNQEADMSMSGGYSRMSTPKSFKLKSGKKYEGANYYPLTSLFPEKPYTRYKDVLVRVGGQDMVDRHQDNLLQLLARRSGFYVDTQAFRPVYVFLNGAYEETLLMREPSNKQYGYSNYGMDTDEMDTLEESDITAVGVASGSRDAFDELCSAARRCGKDDASWRRVQELLDVEEYANYFALELYLANEDWPQNNIKMFRENNTDDPAAQRFHVVVQDLDACFHETGSTFDRIEQFTDYPYAAVGRQENVMLTLFLNLMGREEFRRRFVDAFCLVAGSVFEPATVSAEVSRIADELSVGYVEQRSSLASALSTLRGQLSDSWRANRLRYLARWSRSGLSSASSVTASVCATCEGSGLGLYSEDAAPLSSGLLLNGQPIPRGSFSGTLYLPVQIEAKPLVGKTFKGWTKDGSLITTDATLQLTKNGQYCAVYQDEEDASAASAPVVVNEVSAQNSIFQSERLKRSDWIELYNTTSEPYDISGLYISDDVRQPLKHQVTTLASGTVIPPHGHLVLWADDAELPFKLANLYNSAVVITAPDATWSNTLLYHAHTGRQSVARWPDGGQEVYRTDSPSIASANTFTASAQPLTFDPVLVGVDEAPQASAEQPAAYNLQGRPVGASPAAIRVAKGRKVYRR